MTPCPIIAIARVTVASPRSSKSLKSSTDGNVDLPAEILSGNFMNGLFAIRGVAGVMWRCTKAWTGCGGYALASIFRGEGRNPVEFEWLWSMVCYCSCCCTLVDHFHSTSSKVIIVSTRKSVCYAAVSRQGKRKEVRGLAPG